ncbi:MAG: alpha/beta fold hydrolase [Hyphomicrobiales bacterium]
MANILITGASGFIGSHFLAEYLLARPEAEVFALMRPAARGRPAAERLEAALSGALHAYYRNGEDAGRLAGRVTIIEGDMTAPGCGLGDGDIARLGTAGITQVWHIAADLKAFDDSERASVNVASAASVATLATRIGAPQLVLMSTAYAFGRMAGDIVIDAELPARIEPNNAYELSKFEAEKAAGEIAARHGLRLTVLRPTVVVGHSVTKTAGGSTSGLYGVVRGLLAETRRRRLKAGDRITLHCGTGALNLVPVDRVVDEMLSVATAAAPARARMIRTIAGTDVPIGSILAAIEDRLEVTLERVATDGIAPADQTVNRQLDFFRPYTEPENAKRFAGGSEDARHIHDIDLLNYVEAAIREARFGPLMDQVRIRHLDRPDGAPLVVYESTDFDPALPTTVIVNAYGMPIDAMHPLIAALGDTGANVLSWDCRGLPDQGFDVVAGSLSIEAQLSDWRLVRDAYGLTAVSLVGWSTGAVVASRIAAEEAERIGALVLLHGSYMHPGAELTLFQKNLKSIMPKVAASRTVAALLHKSVFAEQKGALLKLATRGIVKKSEEAMSVTNPAYQHLIEGLTRAPEEVFRYARLIRGFIAENPLLWFGSIRCPITLITGDADRTAHPEGTIEFSRLNRNARLHIIAGGDHFTAYNSAACRRLVLDAVNAATTSRVADLVSP